MRNFIKRLTLTAALLMIGCGSDAGAFLVGNPGLPPLAVADTFSVLGNGILSTVVTANDTPNGGTVSSFQNPSSLGGTVNLNAAGQLTYTAPVNQTNVADTFTYTLSNSVGNSSATVTINIGSKGIFVKNDVAATGTGSQASPFKTLAEAVTEAVGVNGAQIVLFRGDGTNTGLNTGLTLGTNQGISSLDAASPANVTGPINITTGNTIRNLRIIGTAGSGVQGTNASGAVLSGLVIDGPSGRGVSLTNCTGTLAINNSTIRNTGSHGVIASSDTGNLVWSVTSVSFANVTLRDAFSNTSLTASQNITVSNSNVIGGLAEFVSIDVNTTGQVGVNMTNNTCQGGGIKSRGLGILTLNTGNVVALVSGNNITGCANQGALLALGGGANVKARWTGNRLVGNPRSVTITTALDPGTRFGGIFQNNTGDNGYDFTQIGASVFAIESRDQFNGASNNTGTPTFTGTIANAPAGSLNIP